jgi:hypothetical protein
MKILCPYSARKLWYARKIYLILLLSRAIRLEIMYIARHYRFLIQASIGLFVRVAAGHCWRLGKPLLCQTLGHQE